MPITASFSVSQTSDCTKFKITDTTDYAAPEERGDMLDRVLNIYKADGTLYLANVDFNYTDFPDDEIEIEDVDQDYAFTVVMTITPTVVVNDSVYEISDVMTLTCFSKSVLFERQKRMVIEPSLLNNADYLKTSVQIVLDIEAARNAESDNDIVSSQNALDRIKFISDNDQFDS